MSAIGVDVLGTPDDDTIAGDAVGLTPDPIAIAIEAGSGQDSVDGGSNETVRGALDTLDGLGGNDTVVGDVFGDGAGPFTLRTTAGKGGETRYDFSSYTPAPDAGDGGSFNRALGFQDSITGGLGDDALAGDVFSRGGESVQLSVNAGGGGISGNPDTPPGAAGGSSNVARGFDDRAAGAAGDDIIVGDLWKIGGGAVLEASAGSGDRNRLAYGSYHDRLETAGTPGESNRTFGFNDTLGGAAGSDTLVGDAFSEGLGDLAFTVLVGSAGHGADGGASNQASAGNDVIFGGTDSDLLVGDIDRLRALGDAVLLADAGGSYPGWYLFGDGGARNTLHAFNDRLFGGAGGDTVVGDAHGEADLGTLSLHALAGRAADGFSAGSGGDGNAVTTFADALNGGDGEDTLAGDILRSSCAGDVDLVASAGVGGFGGVGRFGGYISGSPGGDACTLDAFNDVVFGGSGDDAIVGDVSQRLSRGGIALGVEAGVGGEGRYNASGGAGGGNNTIRALGDVLRGGAGRDVLIGDVADVDSEGDLAFSIRAGAGGDAITSVLSYSGGAGGDGNRVTAFCDTLAGDADADRLVGDVLLENVLAESLRQVEFRVEAGIGGDNSPAGAGGDDNVVTAFNDHLIGGAGGDMLIGDVADDDFTSFPRIRLFIGAGVDGSEGAPGGTGNAVSAFCDTLLGGDGADLLIGDFSTNDQNSPVIVIQGDGGNTISAFRDLLDGGSGDDTLVGDRNNDSSSDHQIIGSFGGRALQFADTLLGGAGDDVITGGVGADSMSGGAGADRFTWGPFDLVLLGNNFAQIPVVDEITDFAAGDVLDLRSFDPQFFSISADDIRLTVADGDTTVSFRPRDTFVDLVILDDFTTDQTAQELIHDGTILIA